MTAISRSTWLLCVLIKTLPVHDYNVYKLPKHEAIYTQSQGISGFFSEVWEKIHKLYAQALSSQSLKLKY